MRRRKFVQLSATQAGWLIGCDGCDSTDEVSEPVELEAAPELSVLMGHRETAGAMLDTLIPPGFPEDSPGATDARVIVFLDRVLQQPAFARFVRFVKDGLDDLNTASQRLHSKSFAELGLEQREALLRQFQTNRVEGVRVPAATFFNVMNTFALEGFWGAPSHGGNFEQAAWRWAGIRPACVHEG